MFSFIIETALRGFLFFALHFDRTSSFPKPYSKKEESECIKRIKEGDSVARDNLIVHNLRLVAYIVKKYYSDSNEQDDLISIGTIGLIRAVETFSDEKSVNFSTYASKCIDNQIKMHYRKIRHQQTELYMDTPIDMDKDGNPLTIADIFKDLADVESDVDLRIDLQKLYRFINETLDDREKLILSKRYGLSTTKGTLSKPMTQREVADVLDISRSYVSRIEKKALSKLEKRFAENENKL